MHGQFGLLSSGKASSHSTALPSFFSGVFFKGGMGVDVCNMCVKICDRKNVSNMWKGNGGGGGGSQYVKRGSGG